MSMAIELGSGSIISKNTHCEGLILICYLLMMTMTSGCSLFEPREPEHPSQSSSAFLPPTTPEIVIANLQSSIAQRNVQNYINCLDSSRTRRPFTFAPSGDASAQYPTVFSSWTYTEEDDYMSNLVSKAIPGGFSSLLLTQTSLPIIYADSVIYSYDYTFTFQHTEPGFPATARGNLQFALGADNSNFWYIYRWTDSKTTPDITWSGFKGKFSN